MRDERGMIEQGRKKRKKGKKGKKKEGTDTIRKKKGRMTKRESRAKCKYT